MERVSEFSQDVGIVRASDVLGVPRASFYRWRDLAPAEGKERPSPPRALKPQERQAVLDTMNSEEFSDKAPAEVYATLLDRRVPRESNLKMVPQWFEPGPNPDVPLVVP